MAIHLLSNLVKVNTLVLLSLQLICCVPLYNVFFNNNVDKQYQLIIPVLLPFVDIESQTGFYINLMNQSAICLFGIVAIPTIEIITCVIRNNIEVASKLIANSLLTFEENKLPKGNDWKFRQIIQQIMDFDRLRRYDIQFD